MIGGHQKKNKVMETNYQIGATQCLAIATINFAPEGGFLVTGFVPLQDCTHDRKIIDLEMNPKEPILIDKLYKGIQILNMMPVYDLYGWGIEFKV